MGHRIGTDATNLALAGKVSINDLNLYVLHFTRSVSNQKLKLEHIISKTATKLSYIIRSSRMEDVTTENNWILELGVGDGIDIPIYVIVGYMQRDQFNEQHQVFDIFHRPSVVNAQCIIGSEKFPDAGINCNFAIDRSSQAYGEIISSFGPLDKDNFCNHILHRKIF